jgi:fatty-acyl-CoA synthase/long-chain acyl-CoA synthetase
VVAGGAAPPDPAALLAHCRARLGIRAPRKVMMVGALPRNASGKVLRRDLAARAATG